MVLIFITKMKHEKCIKPLIEFYLKMETMGDFSFVIEDDVLRKSSFKSN